MPDFLLPDLGEGLDEAEVIAWRVKPGDRVAVDQVIAEVETAKAVVEVPVPYAGVVTILHAEPGGTVSVGQPLVTVAAEAQAGFREPGIVVPEQAPATPAGTATAGNAPAGDAAANGAVTGTRADGEEASESAVDGEEASGSVLIGYGTGSLTGPAPARSRRGRRRGAAAAPPAGGPPGRPAMPAAPPTAVPAVTALPATGPPATGPLPATSSTSAAAPSPAGTAPSVSATPAPPTGEVAPDRPGRVAVISPLVRKQARDAGLDLTSVAGTGPAGLVSRRDVRQAIAELAIRQQQQAPVVPDAGRAAQAGELATGLRPPAPDVSLRPQAGERRIPLRGARRAAADQLTRSRREIPEATVWVDVDATSLVETRRALNAADPDRPVSLLALLSRFAVLGLRRYSELNARIERDEIVVPEWVNLGFAAQTDHGLVVPVVHDAHRLTTRELSAQLAERTATARERRLTPADLAGGTFTVNNYGVFGVDGSAAIINYPEVAILGMGRVIDRPWVVDGQLTVRKVTELTLAFDHRACDGGTAGGFLRYVADCIESPATALGDL
jgi:2-oxoisovalerate dehydrogenase E2 component (dihydrolipoyl transacylase)